MADNFNELHDLLFAAVKEFLTVWIKDHDKVSGLVVAQQLYLLGGSLRKMAFDIQEECRTSMYTD